MTSPCWRKAIHAKILPMKNRTITLEHALYGLAIALAAGYRFLHLGALPLSDYEADWALQALQVTQGLKPAIGNNPAYVHLTAILFYIFGTTNFLARFWPALAGSALVIAPWFLRNRIGRLPALVLAFGLVIDPGLAAMSHLAGGMMIAITSLVLAGVLWMDRKRSIAGLFAGLALISGPSIWFGLLGLGLAWAFTSTSRKGTVPKTEKDAGDEASSTAPLSSRWKESRGALAWGLGTLVVAGSLFMLSPKGLSGFVMSFVEFLRSWWAVSGIQLWRPLLALPAYEILPLGFGIAGAVRGIIKRDADSIKLGVWALVALVLVFIHPGRQVSELGWAILPLWALTAIELSHHFDFAGRKLWEVAGVMTLVISLSVFGWLDLAGVTTMDLTTETARMRLYLLIAVILLMGLSLVLVGAGWSASSARLGGVWGGVIVLTAFTVAMSTGATGLREPLTAELWLPEPRTGRVDVMLKVANQISDLNKGYTGQLPLTIQGVDSPALHWVFRDWQVTDVSPIAPDAKPEMVISWTDKLDLTADYRGEALPLREAPDWAHATFATWLKWFVYRQMPILRQDVILWVRSDLFLDSQGIPSP